MSLSRTCGGERISALFLILILLRISHTQKVVTAEEEAVQVQAVSGGAADLPCDISANLHNDSVLLVVWYRDDVPIYSWDARSRSRSSDGEEVETIGEGEVPGEVEGDGDQLLEGEDLLEGTHWSGAWGERAHWSPQTSRLTLRPANPTDRGEYRCRADFRASPTRNTRVYLQIIEAVGTPVITNESGRRIEGQAGPYREGETPTLTCSSVGGSPPATVRWYLGGRLLESGAAEGGRATLRLPPLTRSHLLSRLSCHATNTPLLPPASTDILIDMHLAPTSVRVWLSEGEALSAGRPQEVLCLTTGGRPPPSLAIWMMHQQLNGEQQDIEEDKSSKDNGDEAVGKDDSEGMSSSTLKVRVIANSSQHGQRITCRAAHPLLSAPIEAHLTLNVLFPPSVNLSLGAKLNPHDIEEGDDVYFECHVLAHPPPYKLLWEHNGRALVADPKSGITMTGGNLVLRGVLRTAAGNYTCSASNVEGDARSQPVHLQVMYKPVCSTKVRKSYGVGRQERIQLVCEVEAVPPPDSFSWAFNSSAQVLPVAPERYSWTGEPARSTLSFAPLSDLDYGTALCWASNLVGRQAEPCALAVLPAARPHPPANCSLANLTSATLEVFCEEGWDGGMAQHFQLEVWEGEDRLLANVTSPRPFFSARDLPSGRSFRLVLYAHNTRGRSPALTLDAYTLELAEKHTDESVSSSGVGWLAAICGGSLVLLLFLALLVVAVLRIRTRSRSHSLTSHTNYNVTKQKSLRSELQQQLQDDKNPDVVPLSKGEHEHRVSMEGSGGVVGIEASGGGLPRPPPYSRIPPLTTSLPLQVGRGGREVVTTRAPLPAAQESDV